MDVLMGLLAAVLWGATDFLVGMNARAVGVKRAVFFGQLLGLLLMGLIIAVSSQQLIKMVAAPASVLLLACLAALCTLSGALALSKAFAIGKTSVVAPLVTSYGVFTTLLAWLGGETLGTWQIFGLLTCFLGVVLASREAKGGSGQAPADGRLSVGFALLAALLYGVSFWVQGKYALPVLGPVNMLALGYGVGFCSCCLKHCECFETRLRSGSRPGGPCVEPAFSTWEASRRFPGARCMARSQSSR